MSEDESESVETAIEEEPATQPDILERINNNLKRIHEELKILNKGKLRENVRLGALIVTFAVPLSLAVNLMSGYAEYYILPKLEGGSFVYQVSFYFVLTLLSLIILLITYRVYSPLIQTLADSEVKDLMKSLKEEGKKK